jgi:hypothetical protein
VKTVDDGVMSTFYNPYAAKKEDTMLTVVAEEEERFMEIALGNRLSVPLDVQRCNLVFDSSVKDRVKVTSLSFVLQPKSSSTLINFPFAVLPDPNRREEEPEDVFEIRGIELTLLGRVFFLPVLSTHPADSSSNDCETPPSISVYPHLVRAKKEKAEFCPRFEICPSQPRLHLFFNESGAPVESVAHVAFALADGAIVTLPKLLLKNNSGPTLRGKIERLQVFAVDLPGMPGETKLFDTERGVQGDLLDSGRKKPGDANAIPFRIVSLGSSLSLDSLNDIHAGCTMAFQVAAVHNVKRLLPKGATFRLRFRYMGMASTLSEVWRKWEIPFIVNCVNGPRLSSLEFRPDLVVDSAFVELSKSLEERSKEMKNHFDRHPVMGDKENYNIVSYHTPLKELIHIGLYNNIQVSNKDIVFILTIANETKDEIVLSREHGPIGGLFDSPISTILVRAGVSAKVPVLMSRIPRRNEDSKHVDLAESIIESTRLTWAANVVGKEPTSGNIEIQREALQEIIDKHPSFVQRICEPPCEISFSVAGKASSSLPITIGLGKPLDLKVDVKLATWVDAEQASKCTMTLEFHCAQNESSPVAVPKVSQRDFVWCGKLNGHFRMSDKAIKHFAKIMFTNAGKYSVSVCVRIKHDDAKDGVEEIWWAPAAAFILVDSKLLLAQ